MTPRIVQEPASEYHKASGFISRGMLTTYRKRPRLYEQKYVLNQEIDDEPTVAMSMGTAAHGVLLENRPMSDFITIIPRDVLNADGHKKGSPWLAFKAANEGRELLTQKEADRVMACVNSVLSHPQIGQWHKVASLREMSIYWTDEESGLPLRCRPDWLIPLSRKVIANDFKTAKDASEQGLRRMMASDYAFQEIHYSEGITAHFGLPVQFQFTAVDSDEPHTTFIHTISDRAREIAKRIWRKTVNALAESLRTRSFKDRGEDGFIEHDLTERDFKYVDQPEEEEVTCG